VPPIALSEEVSAALALDAPVAVGVSGGKDSQAAALATAAHLDAIGHSGPRLLVHADLGRVEWSASLPTCEALASHLGWELLVVSRTAGDLLDRWRSRWDSSRRRYEALETVKLVLPWSTASMRFCTSELKAAVISSALRRRFPQGPILSVTGVRRDESAQRRRMPVAKASTRLARRASVGWDWNPIIEWSREDVFAVIAAAGLTLHPAYTDLGMSRVSCRFCILASGADLMRAAHADESLDLYRALVDLELGSSFGFQDTRWLADLVPDRLTQDQRAAIHGAKWRAMRRREIEATLPATLLFERGWPTRVPDLAEAASLATARNAMAALYRFETPYLTASAVRDRISELMQLQQGRQAADLSTAHAAGHRPHVRSADYHGCATPCATTSLPTRLKKTLTPTAA
jgi:3'-phosphoadenosine 5'-phosphosulfate sulfotransferase (PAPS reductase)/FAD synthetase